MLAENEDWITGMVTMHPGDMDALHHHRDHLIYVLDGDEVTIHPNGDMEDGHTVPVKPDSGIGAPMAAGAIFSHHIMKNSGIAPTVMVYFEMKK